MSDEKVCKCGYPAESEMMTECQKRYLMDTEEADEGFPPDNSDRAARRRNLRSTREYHKFKERVLSGK